MANHVVVVVIAGMVLACSIRPYFGHDSSHIFPTYDSILGCKCHTVAFCSNHTTDTVWMEGGLANEAKWQARVQELEAKVAAAEKAAAEANGKIETVYVDRVKVVKEIQYVTKTRIDRSAAKIDQNCVIDPEAISILNQAAGAKKK